MKKFIVLALIFNVALTGFAQLDTMYVYNKGTVIRIPVQNIDSITFEYRVPGVFICGVSTVLDVDSNVYNTVLIGNQCWLKENLRVTRYSDGEEIIGKLSEVSAPMVEARNGALYFYDANHATGNASNPPYGLLYNWAAAVRVTDCGGNETFSDEKRQGICPMGWHIPNRNEWKTLEDYLGGSNIAGGKMKSTSYWSGSNAGATNASGFSALPAGRHHNGMLWFKESAFFWGSTQNYPEAFAVELNYFYSIMPSGNYQKYFGHSVRCIKD